ncbi:hypothetical protein FRC17_007998, partial [Serendipita sp. 399]
PPLALVVAYVEWLNVLSSGLRSPLPPSVSTLANAIDDSTLIRGIDKSAIPSGVYPAAKLPWWLLRLDWSSGLASDAELVGGKAGVDENGAELSLDRGVGGRGEAG